MVGETSRKVKSAVVPLSTHLGGECAAHPLLMKKTMKLVRLGCVKVSLKLNLEHSIGMPKEIHH